MTAVKVPELCLVVLIGPTGSGKSTFAARHFRPTEVLSSDFFRGLVGDDETDQSLTAEAFGALHEIAARRLRLGRLTVVDATSVHSDARRPLVTLARDHHVLPVAVVLDVPPGVCIARNATRPGRDFGAAVVRRQPAALTRSSPGRLQREGFRRVFVLRGVAEVDAATVEREPSWSNRSADHGPFDVVGDVHGCAEELASLLRALRGRDAGTGHGLAQSLAQLAAEPEEFRARVAGFLDGLISHYVLDSGRLVVAHAGLPEQMHGRASAAVRAFALYGDTTGETDEFGLPVRYPWAEDYRGTAMVVYGHTPGPRGGLLDVAGVLGRRGIDTGLRGRVTIPEPNAAAALEVMSRFAADPRWLIYLPPTMAPVPASDGPGLLEHPAGALAAYARDGVALLVCEEKHMGSRAVMIVCQGPAVAPEWFGTGGPGIVYTRTGRRFFADPVQEEALLGRVGAALGRAGLWAELGEWVALDCEILPWSFKAEELVRDQYAAVGAAATASLAAAAGLLAAAAGRGMDVAALRERTAARQRAAEAFTAAYRRYVWPVTSLDDIRVAPFQVLAGAAGTRFGSAHRWHLEIAERLAAADPVLIPTRHIVADPCDPRAAAAVTSWWEELTADGGEGMVAKPAEPVTRGRRGLAQPGIKCRGPEYLRIIYGPEYTLPPNLVRLRERHLARKRSLAVSEFALGAEALERFVRREPLHRVHECVFGVLALESEPVDPRL